MKLHMVCGIAAGAITMMFIGCNKGSNPVAPSNPQVPGRYLVTEGFETDLSNYNQLTYAIGWGKMSISTGATHSGKQSLSSDSNRTGIKANYDPISDSIAGLDFYLMAKKAGGINFYAALSRSGSSWNGLFAILGLGIGKSDSLQYIYEIQPVDSTNEHKNFAPVQFNHWYHCRVECSFTDTIVTYSVDDVVVKTIKMPFMSNLGMFVTMRDDSGSQGTKDYYFDDVTVYKR
jgi:hypothetical protein